MYIFVLLGSKIWWRKQNWWWDCVWLAGRIYDSDEEYDDRGKRRRRHSDSDSDSQAEGEEAPLCDRPMYTLTSL